jgi:uncharacterized membrane protein YfcA
MILGLPISFGILVGFVLGLTGGGGSIFAVPLLVYGLSLGPHQAIGISLVAVGATAALGFLQRWRKSEVDVRTGLLFAASGMLGAPLGSFLNQKIGGELLLLLFSGLMVVVAIRMWKQAAEVTKPAEVGATAGSRLSDRRVDVPKRSLSLLCLVGFATGLLCGFFGVGGGFIIVPALVLFSGIPIHRAIATSLLIISLLCASALTTYWFGDRAIDLVLAGLFVLGGSVGTWLGAKFCSALSGPLLQKLFSAAMVLVAIFVTARNMK